MRGGCDLGISSGCFGSIVMMGREGGFEYALQSIYSKFVMRC